MNRVTQRQYQTVEQALKVINDAEKFGGIVKVNKSGELERSDASTNLLKNFFRFFRKKSDTQTKNQEVIETVLNKMKIEIIQASSHVENVSNLLETKINDLKEFKGWGGSTTTRSVENFREVSRPG